MTKKLCLNMIVKNEAPVIRRCLESVLPIIDCWVIVDTGSTDGTQEVIRSFFREHGLPGELYEKPWKDFAYNRSEALALARSHAAYTLIIDADDTLEVAASYELPELTADSYVLDIQDTNIRYQRMQVVRNALPWRYRGVLHEFLTCDGAGGSEHLPILMRRNHDGARRRDPKTYLKDTEILKSALLAETDPFLAARYSLYLAQSYRDCGEKERALELYLARGKLGFWQEEVFVALYEAAKLMEALGRPDQEVIDAYLRAANAQPTRAEALHGATRFCRYKGKSEEGYQIGKRGLEIAPPSSGLFVETWIYDYGLLDEYAVNAYWSEHYHDCLEASLKALSGGKVPPDQAGRIFGNANAALSKLPKWSTTKLFAEDFLATHELQPPRQLFTAAVAEEPHVLLAILAKQKETALPLYLETIEHLDYPKSAITLYVRTNNNTDRTEAILREWIDRVGHLYRHVEFDASEADIPVHKYKVHEWNGDRFKVLGHIRNVSMKKAIEHGCDFYFVYDVDNFVIPSALRELVRLDLPIVAPLLRQGHYGSFDTSFFSAVDPNGYYQEDLGLSFPVLTRAIRGVIEEPLIHQTYLIRKDIIPLLTYDDGSGRYEFVIFSDSARKAGVPQYVDNRQVYGHITSDDEAAYQAKMEGKPFEGNTAAARQMLEKIWADYQPRHSSCSNTATIAASPQAPANETKATSEASQFFSRIYDESLWPGGGSGYGSHPVNSVDYMRFVSEFLTENKVRSIVDLGCGDWQFSRFFDFGNASYTGFDVVPSVISANIKSYARSGVEFRHFSSLADLPSADLLLCKDVLQHLPNDIVTQYLAAFRKKFKFALITNDGAPADLVNSDIPISGWRPVRLDQAPFFAPAAIVFSWTLMWDVAQPPARKFVWLMHGDR